MRWIMHRQPGEKTYGSSKRENRFAVPITRCPDHPIFQDYLFNQAHYREEPSFMLTAIDWTIMIVYLVFVLGIVLALKRYMRTSTDFFLPGRSIPAWVCGLAFISANLGAQEVIGM